ncbi:BRCA1-A complex subunit RAP80 isoform X2 [Boleophthalmus pectinirostris]|uniref:BRCA1-A complex subunit RAP80 isoform X2 n=1 Tax=Boleophthalmus pectinirostris TaxID=150288 RepID=UPI0024313426|nr:BRCA1-A complex subunit RAP80 isoform X2 [Boleophthalmus pectinirostris]
MPLRKRINRENAGVLGESQQRGASDTQEDDDEVQCPAAAAREMRRRERQLMSKPKEMTEEEMMDLALRLSEQEANIRAQRIQEEDAAVKKAIQDSMISESQSLIDDAPVCAAPRRKLVYSNGNSQPETTDSSTQEGRGQRATGHMSRTRKRRRAVGSPLMEMPDLSQTQPSPSSPESVPLGSPQSCDSTQIEDCELPKSPVFPSSSSGLLRVQAMVHVPKLDQNLLDACTASGFVLCSQDSSLPSQNFHSHQLTRSPTFHKSPGLCSTNPTPKSTNTHPQTEIVDLDDDTPPAPSSPPCKSPVLGQTDLKSALKSETSEATALVFSSQGSSLSFISEKDVSLIKSPVFSKTQRGREREEESGCKSPVFGTNKLREKASEDEAEDTNAEERQDTLNLSEREPTCDMTLHWSDEDEDNAMPVVSPSPVFPEEKCESHQTEREAEESAPTQNDSRAAGARSQSATLSQSAVPGVSGGSTGQDTVHYYWGVPFCPRGLDPNLYTKVIVAQMEVYEKSLKQAQRGLLHKLEWGGPVLPQPEKSPSPEPNSPQIHLPTRRSRRQKGKLKEHESNDELEEVGEETESQREEEEEEGEEEGDKSAGEEREKETRIKETEEEEPNEKQALFHLKDDETQVESDCEVCPETQLSDNDLTQELTLPSQPAAVSPEIETVQVDSPIVVEQAEHEESMETGPESQEGPKESPEQLHFKPADVDLDRPSCDSQSREEPGPQRSESPDLDSDLAPGPEGPVQCPICQRAFPSDQIEMHAAFCDGEPSVEDRASLKLRRKRTRRGEAEDSDDTEPSGAQEKCYVCGRAIPIREYSLHTEMCFQRRPPRAAATGGLLSALDQSEHKDSEAGPSGFNVQPHDQPDRR